MQARIMEQVKDLAPLTNLRIAMSVDEAVSSRGLLRCSSEEAHFNHVMRDGVQIGGDFEVLSRDQWCLLGKFFGERSRPSEEADVTLPVPLTRSYELLGLGIRT